MSSTLINPAVFYFPYRFLSGKAPININANMKISSLSFLIFFVGMLSNCATGPGESLLYDSVILSDSTIVFIGVNLITMGDEGILTDQTVVIRDGKIQQTGKSRSLAIPENAVVLDAGDRYLIPGLFDMHVHLHEQDINTYLSYGITGIRNMWGTPNVKTLIQQIEEGTLRGPVIRSASPGIDGNPPSWPYTQIIEDPDEASQLVMQLKSEGWSFLKIYNQLTPEVYRSVVKAAQEQDIPFLGHVPIAVTVQEVLKQGQYSIEHLTGYDQLIGGRRGFGAWVEIDGEPIPGIVKETQQAMTWNCPTLVVLDHLSRQLENSLRNQAEENRLMFVKALYEEGAGLLLGSDAGINLTQPGLSLHEEMQKFVQAGIPPQDVLKIATIKSAEFLGIEDETGTITPGKRANLVLLNANPLEDIKNTTRIEGIVLNGEWIPLNFFK